MKKDFMEELKKEYNAWLVVHMENFEDSGDCWDAFLIFTEDNKVLNLKHAHSNYTVYKKDELKNAKEEISLDYYKSRLEDLLPALDTERSNRLKDIIKNIILEDVEFLKKYINKEITERGLDEHNQIEIDFTGLGEKETIIKATEQLGYEVEKGEGQGVYWIYK